MCPKVDMKKIENPTKCQVAFSKRRSSLFRKTHEISVLCDVDLVLIAFSPSGRLNKFCSQKRIEDVMQRYIDLPPDKRFRDYEPEPGRDPSLAQLLWCEKNLKTSLQRVVNKKRTLLGNLPSLRGDFRVSGHDQAKQMVGISSQVLAPISCDCSQNELIFATQNPAFSNLIMQLDPWISPYRFFIIIIIFITIEVKVVSSRVRAPNFTMTNLPSVYQSGLPLTTPETYVPPGYTHALTQVLIFNNSDFSFNQNNLDWQNSLAPMTWLNENPNEVNQVTYGNSNTSQTMNVNLPLTSKGVLSPSGYEPFFSNNAVATSSYSNNNNSKNGDCDANEKLLGSPSQVLPLPGSSKDLKLPIVISNEGMMGYESNGTLMNNASNKDDGSWEWDDLVLAKNFNLEDLDDLI
ncbi:hypothetical protein SO802_025168 [Lithocarpus litseifolius]|uniref:MADS-box domain-containing protein n=1 Tax=Lithocarpus litseifolius TaxID=425828 RepID=A0AAW2BY42_9ROSI